MTRSDFDILKVTRKTALSHETGFECHEDIREKSKKRLPGVIKEAFKELLTCNNKQSVGRRNCRRGGHAILIQHVIVKERKEIVLVIFLPLR